MNHLTDINKNVACTDCSIKFVIIMPTYYRKNNSTKQYLYRSISSILNQVYTNWDLIIVGDKYDNEDELISIIYDFRTKTNNNIIYINNQIVERDHVTDKLKLWHCAGANSINIGLKYARKNNYKFYAHIDDDDWWENNHLKVLADAYINYQHCIFVNTQSKYGVNNILPKSYIQIYPNNLLPTPCGMIHSSFSFRIDIINFNYLTNIYNGIDYPSDANMLNNIKNFIINNNKYCSIYMPFLTCNHIEERAYTK